MEGKYPENVRVQFQSPSYTFTCWWQQSPWGAASVLKQQRPKVHSYHSRVTLLLCLWIKRQLLPACIPAESTRRNKFLAPQCPEQPRKCSDRHVVIPWDDAHADPSVVCKNKPFGKAEIRLKNVVCTEAQNIINLKQMFNGNAKQTKKKALSPRYDTSLTNS